MANELQGKKIAFLAAKGFEESELLEPWKAVKGAGADVELVSLEEGEIVAQNEQDLKPGASMKVDRTVEEARADDYDGLVLPGGVMNPDKLRLDENAVHFVRSFFEQGKPVGAICHGPWTLVEAGGGRDRTLTSLPSIRTGYRHGGKRKDSRGVRLRRMPSARTEPPEVVRRARLRAVRPRSSADRAVDFESTCGGSTPPGATPPGSPAPALREP